MGPVTRSRDLALEASELVLVRLDPRRISKHDAMFCLRDFEPSNEGKG